MSLCQVLWGKKKKRGKTKATRCCIYLRKTTTRASMENNPSISWRWRRRWRKSSAHYFNRLPGRWSMIFFLEPPPRFWNVGGAPSVATPQRRDAEPRTPKNTNTSNDISKKKNKQSKDKKVTLTKSPRISGILESKSFFFNENWTGARLSRIGNVAIEMAIFSSFFFWSPHLFLECLEMMKPTIDWLLKRNWKLIWEVMATLQ